MTCFHPLEGAKIAFGNDGTSTYVSFKSKDLEHPNRVGTQYVSCGQCLGCRLESSRQWAMRCVAELSQHQTACFLTLTFDNEHLPKNGSVSKEFFCKWIKNLREKIRYETAIKFKVPGKRKPQLVGGIQIRFFGCGEYGDKRGRPHYHLIVFGFRPYDLEFREITRNGDVLYTSEFIKELWPYGFHTVGEVTFESCAYVARYVTKKYMGKAKDAHYGDLEPEFIHMSRRNGIGYDWFQKYHSDVYPYDEFEFRGKTFKPPRYFDQLLKKLDFEQYHAVKNAREEKFNESPWALMTWEERELELARKEEALHHKYKKYLKRSYEEKENA